MSPLLESLRGRLIVSVQAEASSPLNSPEAIALLARGAVAGGAAAVRIEGLARIAAVRAAVTVPIIGLVKRSQPGFEPYITPTLAEARAVAAAGAEIVAFDATARARADGSTVESLAGACHAAGALAMADCAGASDGEEAARAGADLIATTLAGYTEASAGRSLPAFDLLAGFARLRCFAVCEGGIGTPAQASRAFAEGADAIVVGTAITNVEALTRRFAEATPLRNNRSR